MNVSSYKKYVGFGSSKAIQPDNSSCETTSSRNKKSGLLDKFESGVKNSADLNDTIKVPRTIFKGYLAFMVSTTLLTLASFVKDKSKLLPKVMNISSALIALYGTYSFVKPYLIRNSSNESSSKNIN